MFWTTLACFTVFHKYVKILGLKSKISVISNISLKISVQQITCYSFRGVRVSVTRCLIRILQIATRWLVTAIGWMLQCNRAPSDGKEIQRQGAQKYVLLVISKKTEHMMKSKYSAKDEKLINVMSCLVAETCWAVFNTLRTGSFKLFKRPFPVFLTILTF